MSRRQSLDKPAILSPPVQFIVPSPTASASPSPRLIQNCSPNATAVALAQHQSPQQQQFQQHRNLLSDVVLVTSPHDIAARRLSTGSNPAAAAAAAAGGTILLRQSPSQSPSHNIIFTNGPQTSHPTPSSTPTPPTGHEFNTTLVGSNNIALNVKRGSGSSGGGGTIFGGHLPINNFSIGHHGGNRRLSTGGQQHVQHSNNGGAGGAGGGGASPKPGKRPVTLTQSSPVPSPMASPTMLKQNTPNQSPIHHQIPILTSPAGGQPMYQLIQTSAGTQQLIQTAGPAVTAANTVHHRQQPSAMPLTFNAPTMIQQATGGSVLQPMIPAAQPQPPPPPPPLHHQAAKSKGPQQILPKPATGIGTNKSSKVTVTPSSSPSSSSGRNTPVTSNGMTNGPVQTILSAAPTNPANTSGNPIQLLPTAQPHQLIMSANQMPMLVQQNTPQGVQFILRQPTNQLTTAPLMLAGGAAGNRGQPTIQTGQPQQLLRIVNGNGQVQFSPATTTFIMSSQGNLIQQIQAAPTTTQSGQHHHHQQQHHHHQQMKAATDIQQKLNPIQLGQTINGNLVQMSTGQFISQFPAQNFNFANHQLVTAAAPSVTFSANGQSAVDGQQQQSTAGGGGGSGGQTIQFNNVMQPPIQIHHQQQIISPIASPALQQQQQQQPHPVPQVLSGQQNQLQQLPDGQMMIVQQQKKPQVITPPTPVKPKKEKKETKKEKAAKEKAAKKSSPVIIRTPNPTPPPPPLQLQPPVTVSQPEPPPPPGSVQPKGKLDLANVMIMCGIGLDDDDDDEEMLLDTDYQPPPPPSQPMEDEHLGHSSEEQQMTIDNEILGSAVGGEPKAISGDIMITIPGVNSSESIPISFSIPASATGASGGGGAAAVNADEVISLDDSWSPQKMQSSVNSSETGGAVALSNKLIDDNMCVDTFVNSVLDSQMTPTLQSQIAEIQNQLMGVTSEPPIVASTTPKTTAMVQPTTNVKPPNAPKMSVAGQQQQQQQQVLVGKQKTTPGVSVPKQKTPKKSPANKKQTNSHANSTKDAAVQQQQKQMNQQSVTSGGHLMGGPKVVNPTMPPMTMPSQIGNIQISQVDSSNVKPTLNKVATSIDNQIQITPILDAKQVNSNFNATVSTGGSSNMTVTMKTVAVSQSIPQQQVTTTTTTAMPKLQPVPMLARQTPQAPQAVMPSVQINLQAPNPQPGLQLAMQQHPLLSQLTGALSLNLMDDGRLVLKHDVNAPQDAQSQMILQTILSGALPNLTLINEPKQAPPPPQIIEQQQQPQFKQNVVIQQQQKIQVQQQQPPQIRKAIVEPQPQMQANQQQQQQQQPPQMMMTSSQGNIVELPKIGPDKQLFKMNMATNQITQISAGATTALVGPMEQLLIVPADINPQQLAQCQAAGQLQLHNMGHLKPSQTSQQQQQPHPPQVQLKPQPVMPGLVNSATGAPVKNVIAPQQQQQPQMVTAAKKGVNKKNQSKEGNKGSSVLSTAKVAPSQVVKQQQVVIQQQQQQQSKLTKPPILKNNHVMISKMKAEGAGASNTAVVRPNTVQNQATVKPHTITLPAANKITITTGGVGQQHQQQQIPGANPPTAIMQNLQKNTQIVLPSSNSSVQKQQSNVVGISQQQSQPPPRVQTIQLTPQNQQILKEVQMKIQILSGKFKDKNLLETLTFPIELDENNPINRQPLPTLQNCSTMTDKDIHVALQRLFIEQQKILATGKVIPTISNYPNQQQQQVAGGNVMQVPPTVNNGSKIQLQSGGSGGAAEMVKNWPLMKTQQINEMTIKPISATSSSPFPVPNKVINSTTIIPAPVGGQMATMGSGGGMMTTTTTVNTSKKGETGTMSITPVVMPVAGGGGGSSGMQQLNKQQQIQVHNKAVISGISQGNVNKAQMIATGLVSHLQQNTSISGPNGMGAAVKQEKIVEQQQQKVTMVVKLEDMQPVQQKIKEEIIEPLPTGKSPQELAEMVKRFERRVKYDQECCTQPDTETPFRGKMDAVMRLLGYHCNYREHEPEYPEEEVRFQEAAVSVQEGLGSLRQRFQGLLMNGSMLDAATSERVMVERYLKSDVEQEIADIKAEIERLKNPEPPPLVQIQEQRPIVETFKPIVEPFKQITPATSGLLPTSAIDDEATRLSDVTDSRSMGGGLPCDVKSESAQFGWNDEWSDDEEEDEDDMDEEENSSSMAGRLNAMSSSSGAQNHQIKAEKRESGGFDIESEILPNFILNMKKSSSGDPKDVVKCGRAVEDIKRDAVQKVRALESPVDSVKSEGYDEWASIQKELASMGAASTDAMTEMAGHHPQQHQPQVKAIKTEEKPNRFESAFDKIKKPWMTEETSTEVQLSSRLSVTGGGGSGGSSLVTKTSHFFSLETSNHSEPESWLDFQHNNNSFDFPIVAPATTAGGSTGGGGGPGVGQLMNGTHNPQTSGSVTSSTASQKRPWNGIAGSDNGAGNSNGATGGGLLNGGGVDDFYAKKMCYGNGDFDFNHFVMGEGASNHHQGQQQQQSQHNFNPNGNNGGLEHPTHSQNIDEDINRQMQSAIDSILNLQGSDATDFHFNLDPAMGALLGGGDSSSGGHHHPMDHQPLMGSSQQHHGGAGISMGHQNHNHQLQHMTHVVGGGGGGGQSSLASAMILSDDEDEEDEQQRAIKSVLLS